MYVVCIQTVPELHLLLSRIGISIVILSTKVHFVSIPTVPEMHLFLSRIGKHMHSNGHLEHQKPDPRADLLSRSTFVCGSTFAHGVPEFDVSLQNDIPRDSLTKVATTGHNGSAREKFGILAQ